MKLFFDESIGTRVPSALRHIRAPCSELLWPSSSGAVRFGATDIDWLTYVGENGYLAISENVAILDVVAERQALFAAASAVLFLKAGQQPRWKVLHLLLHRWDWLQGLYDTEPRPFAFTLGINGRSARVRLA